MKDIEQFKKENKELKRYKSNWNALKKSIKKASKITTSVDSCSIGDIFNATAIQTISQIYLNEMERLDKGYYVCPKCKKHSNLSFNLLCEECASKQAKDIEDNRLWKLLNSKD